MKENYTYPAVVDYGEEGFVDISFPDFEGAFTNVETGEDYVTAAQEVLALAIQDCLDRNSGLPAEGNTPNIEEGQRIVYINVWMPYHQKKMKTVYVKKTLTIPAWLDILAKESQINFSAVLVEGLKNSLGLNNKD